MQVNRKYNYRVSKYSDLTCFFMSLSEISHVNGGTTRLDNWIYFNVSWNKVCKICKYRFERRSDRYILNSLMLMMQASLGLVSAQHDPNVKSKLKLAQPSPTLGWIPPTQPNPSLCQVGLHWANGVELSILGKKNYAHLVKLSIDVENSFINFKSNLIINYLTLKKLHVNMVQSGR